MSEFVNTIDILGDVVVMDAIIDCTITEFKDDQITKIGTMVFAECDKLESIEFPNVTILESAAFQSCTSLKEITANTFPKVTSVNGSGAGTGIFSGCTSLETVAWPSLEKSGHVELFNGCTSLTSADLPNLTTCANSMFNGCKSLTEVNLPKLTKLAANFAMGCTSLKKLTLPSVVECAGGSYFRSGPAIIDLPVCTKLSGAYGIGYTSTFKALILRSPTVCVLDSNMMFNNNTPIENGTGFIYVPRALIDSYKAATNWSTRASSFRALEDYTVDGTITGELDESKI